MKSIPFPELCGESYSFINKYAAIEQCVNWYPVSNESKGDRQFPLTLAPSPSNAAFSTNHNTSPFNQAARGLFTFRQTAYGVNGTCFFEINASGVMTNRGTVLSDGAPCTFAANYTGQIFIASFNHGYVYDTASTTFTDLTGNADFLGSSFVTFQDGYMIVLNPIPTYPNQIQISGNDTTPVGDATVWSALNISAQAGQSDYLRCILSCREYVRLWGQRRSQVFTNVGAGGVGQFPFQTYNETFIETGIASPWSAANMGDSLIWIGEDDRGVRSAWMDPAFQPHRVSTYAVEQQWQSYSIITDAVSFSFIWNGHLMYQVTFQTAGHTWVYDHTESTLQGRPIWHERTALISGVEIARAERYHCYCYNKHLVGSVGTDGAPGAVYYYSDTQYGDTAGNPQFLIPMNRTRVTPHIWNGFNRIIYNRIEFEVARGVGNSDSPNPVINLSWSDDGGQTFGAPVTIAVGAAGQFGKRVFYDRLGYSRDRVFKIVCSDLVYWGLIGAQLSLTPCAS